MGILNVTPDSFSDGGEYFEVDRAVERAKCMVKDGADILDVGGESTRPGSDSISVDEELRRVIPVIERLSDQTDVPISIDTYKAEVAKKAIDAGADMVNDISGLRFDPVMAKVIAEHDVPVVIMHIKGTPRNMQKNPVYDNLISEIAEYLKESIDLAEKSGVASDKIIIDPGIGFGKTYEHNLEIVQGLPALKEFGKPILIGPSRKAFIGRILGDVHPSERVEGTAAVIAISIMMGANIVRVHDVKEMVRVSRVADAVKSGRIDQKIKIS